MAEVNKLRDSVIRQGGRTVVPGVGEDQLVCQQKSEAEVGERQRGSIDGVNR